MKLQSTGIFVILLAGWLAASPVGATEPSPFALPPAGDEEQSATTAAGEPAPASPFVLPAEQQPPPKAPAADPQSAFERPATGTVVDLGAPPPPAGGPTLPPATIDTVPTTAPTPGAGTPAGGLSAADLLGMGTDFARQGRYEEARAALEKAVAIDPTNAYVLNNLGLVMRRLGRIDEATRAYAAAIQFNPGYALTYKNYGILLEQNGETRRAIDAYRRYASLAPSAPDAGKVSQRADWLAGGN
jgi:hypothetical protein